MNVAVAHVPMFCWILVRKGGLDPPRPYRRSHLKAVRLPISPLPRVSTSLALTSVNSYLTLLGGRTPRS